MYTRLLHDDEITPGTVSTASHKRNWTYWVFFLLVSFSCVWLNCCWTHQYSATMQMLLHGSISSLRCLHSLCFVSSGPICDDSDHAGRQRRRERIAQIHLALTCRLEHAPRLQPDRERSVRRVCEACRQSQSHSHSQGSHSVTGIMLLSSSNQRRFSSLPAVIFIEEHQKNPFEFLLLWECVTLCLNSDTCWCVCSFSSTQRFVFIFSCPFTCWVY